MNTGASVKSDEEEFFKVLESRAKNADGKLKIVDVNKNESDVQVRELLTLHKVRNVVFIKFQYFSHCTERLHCRTFVNGYTAVYLGTYEDTKSIPYVL